MTTKRHKIGARDRFDVLRRCGFTCFYCGVSASRAGELHIDHVTPVALGGTNAPWNLVAACAPCNLGKADTPPSPAVTQRAINEYMAYTSPRTAARIVCRFCHQVILLEEGDEAYEQCSPCTDWRIEAYEAGYAAATRGCGY